MTASVKEELQFLPNIVFLSVRKKRKSFLLKFIKKKIEQVSFLIVRCVQEGSSVDWVDGLKLSDKWFSFTATHHTSNHSQRHLHSWIHIQMEANKLGWPLNHSYVMRAPFLLLRSYLQTKKEYWMKRLISNLQVNLPAGKDGDRYNVPWRRKLMIFWEAFHLSLRLQKTKLLFPTIKDTGKVDVERMQQIRKRSW